MFSTVVVWVKLMMAQSIVLGKVLCYTLYVLQGPSWQSRFLKFTQMDESQNLLKSSFDIMRFGILLPKLFLTTVRKNCSKGQLISKQNCRAITSPTKQMLDFYF